MISVGVLLLYNSIISIIGLGMGTLQLPRPSRMTLIVAFVSLLIKLFLYRYTYQWAGLLKSSALKAKALDHRSDTLALIAVLIGIAGAIFLGKRWLFLEPLAAGVVSLFIIHMGWSVLRPAFNELTEECLSPEIEGEMGDSHVGLQARLMSQALRKITGALSATGTTAIFINQLREKIGVFFGSPETTTGGKALKFYASVRIDVRRIETLKEAGAPVGNRTRAKVVKNKMAPPFKQAEFDIVYGKGISREGSIIDMGVEAGIVRKSGSWFTYGDDQLGQGKENVRQFLVDNPELANEIEQKILVALGIAEEPEPEKNTKKASAVDPDEDAGF